MTPAQGRAPSDGQEPSITQRLNERPNFKLSRVRSASPQELGVRFLAGALASVLAGLLTLAVGPRVGGVMLAFPAILAASLTLIEEQEDSEEAREDARGAAAGAVALVGFAAVSWLLLDHLAGALVLLSAVAVWLTLSLGLYTLLWWRRGGPQSVA